MADRHVVGLEVVVHGDLPVDIPMLDVQRAERLQSLEPMRREVLEKASPQGFEWLGVACEVHEYEAGLNGHACRLQPMLAAIQPRKALPHRHANELAAEPIRP